jgi:hypothetical protein
MFCPRCGRQPIADELRFCSYCGLKLAVVKATLADSEEIAPAGLTDARTLLRQPRNREISIGVILMFVGTLLAILIGRMGGREAAALALTMAYSLTLLFSGPITKAVSRLFSWDEQDANLSAARKGMGFGATLMLLSTIAVTIGSLLMFGRMRTEPFFIGLFVAFALLLVVSRFLMRGLQYLVTEESTVLFAEPARGLALQAGQDEPVSVFSSQRVQTAEIVSPGSITEHTTNLLNNRD